MRINEELMQVISEGKTPLEQLKLRAVVYARVSTDHEEQLQSFNNQLETYKREIEANPNWRYIGAYSDEGITGSSASIRVGLQQMLADAKEGKFDLIVTKSISRFARNVKDCLNYIDRFKRCGVAIYFDQENIVSIRTKDTLMLQFLAMGAEMESRSAKERTKVVFDKGIANGRIYGNSKILGYRKDKCRLVVDEYEAEIVRTIFDLYVHQRLGMRRIAKELASRGMTRKDGGLIATSTIQSVLQNPKYKGVYCGGKTALKANGRSRRLLPESQWTMFEDPSIPVIIPPDLWEEAARIRAGKSQKFREEVKMPCNEGKYRYSRKLVSGINPELRYQRFLSRYKDSKREGWYCRNHKDPAHPENIGPAVYSDELDRVMVSILDEIVGNYDEIVEDMLKQYRLAVSSNQIQEKLKRVEGELQKIAKARERDLIAFEAEAITVDELKKRKEEGEKKTARLLEQKEQLSNAGREIQKVLDGLADMRDRMKEAIRQQTPTREMIDILIDRIIIGKDSTRKELHLEIYFKAFKNFKSYTIFRGVDGKKQAGEDLCECSDKGTYTVANPEEAGLGENLPECYDKCISMSASRTLPS